MKKARTQSTYGTAVSHKIKGPVSYIPKEHPMKRMTKELSKKRKLDPARKGTAKSPKAK